MSRFIDAIISNSNVSSNVRISIKCSVCGIIKSLIYKEYKRLIKRQSKYVDSYHCPKCLIKNNNYIKYRKKRADHLRTEEWADKCRIRSKNAWNSLTDEEKNNRIKCSRDIVKSDKVKFKISASIKKKFNDKDYINKISKARKKYWNDAAYRNNRILSVGEFKKRSIEIHGNKYNYSLVSFDIAKDSVVKIICPEHGVFEQRVLWHSNYGNGCPKCATVVSKPHQEIIDYIKSLVDCEIIINDREQIGFELDIFIPDYKFAIEYNGNWFHSYDNINKLDRLKCFIKSLKSYKIGIKLFQITEDYWIDICKNKIVKSMIRNNFGLNNKIYAKNCLISLINKCDYKEFFDSNHLYGNKYASVAFGLIYNNELLFCMSFQRKSDNWEIARLATKIGNVVVGGVSRIFKKFITDYSTNTIISYADRMISQGNVYLKLGFELSDITKPNYKYLKNNITYSRQHFQKHKLKNILNVYDKDMTEHQNMFMNGYRIIWDAGHNKYIWNRYLNKHG